jgi:alpha-1,2-mannosyltransferase
MARFVERWRALSPLTRGLAAYVPLACIAINIALPNLPWQPQLYTALDYTNAWSRGIAHSDSWKPMRMGLAYLDEPGERPLYQEIFFERGVKLQYPPTSLLFVDALRRLPGRDWTSDASLNAISWLAVLLSALLAARILDVASRQASGVQPRVDRVLRTGIALLAALSFYPLVRGFYLGQVQTFIDALLAGLFLAWLQGRALTSGVLAGLVCVIKPQLGLLVLWAALRGRWRFVAGWTLCVCVALGISLASYGLAAHLDYMALLSFIAEHGEGFHPNQSVNGLLNRMLGVGNNLEWKDSALAPFDARVYWLTLSTSLALVAFALFWRRGQHRSAPVTDLAICIVSATLASPVAWTHHYAVLLPVFAAAVPATWAARRLGAARFILLAVSYLLIANNYRALNRLAETPFNLLQSYVLFGGLLLLFHLYRLRQSQATAAPRAASI